eukprot:465232-Pleurochrysis_carterae.AAC.1
MRPYRRAEDALHAMQTEDMVASSTVAMREYTQTKDGSEERTCRYSLFLGRLSLMACLPPLPRSSPLARSRSLLFRLFLRSSAAPDQGWSVSAGLAQQR